MPLVVSLALSDFYLFDHIHYSFHAFLLANRAP